jgi:hypothetical protein
MPGVQSTCRRARGAISSRSTSQAAAPDQALAVARAADLGTASYVERFKAAEGTAKTLAFYDLALLNDLAQLYRELARRRLEQAAADPRTKPTAEYYLAEALSGLGENDKAAESAQAVPRAPQAPAQYRERARAATGADRLSAREKGRCRARLDQHGRAELRIRRCSPRSCSAAPRRRRNAPRCLPAPARRPRRAMSGAPSAWASRSAPTISGSRTTPARSPTWRAGRDKSNKNKIEANDPEMLAALAEAYYRTKKFSEGLEIFFEMSQEFAVVRQIQEACRACTPWSSAARAT